MVCDTIINNLELKLGRKLTKEEKKKIQEALHHSEINIESPKFEELQTC